MNQKQLDRIELKLDFLIYMGYADAGKTKAYAKSIIDVLNTGAEHGMTTYTEEPSQSGPDIW